MSLGYSENYITSKHKQLLGWFNKTYIYDKKIFSVELFQIYHNAYDNRMESDYAPFMKLIKEDVLDNYNNAFSFDRPGNGYNGKVYDRFTSL